MKHRAIPIILFAAALSFFLGSCRSTPTNPGGGTDTTGNGSMTSAIDGLVLQGQLSGSAQIGNPNMTPLAGATISISQANTAVKPTVVVSDSLGKFYLKVAPGTFTITAGAYSNSGWPRPPAAVTIQVPANTTVKDTLRYDTGTPTDTTNNGSVTAIDGMVLKGPIMPVDRPGVPNVAPLAGATISISQPNSSRAPITVVSDTAGKFFVKVSAGTYLVTPTAFQNSIYPRPQSPQTIYVPAGTTLKDTLNYDTGIR